MWTLFYIVFLLYYIDYIIKKIGLALINLIFSENDSQD